MTLGTHPTVPYSKQIGMKYYIKLVWWGGDPFPQGIHESILKTLDHAFRLISPPPLDIMKL